MKTLLGIICFLMISTPALAAEWFERFDGKDWSYQGVFTAVTVVDWMQTSELKNYDNLHETNPILGQYPTDTAIDAYFTAAILGHGLVSWALPKEINFNNGFNLYPRRIWQAIWVVVETKQVYDNYQLGIRISF